MAEHVMRALRAPFDVELPGLEADEKVLLDSVASLLGLVPSRGRLVLSTRRLFYMPWTLRFLPRWLK
ncbi:MAG: hypothetical protein ACRD1T_27145, partial [Acidimicrobiia bacterium]